MNLQMKGSFDMKKYKKYIPLLLFFLLTVFYFEYSVTILWDSAHYMSYVNIFEGALPWNTWDVVRGPVFPFIIFGGNFLFGKTTQGLLMNSFCYYLLFLLFCYKVLCYFFNKINLKKTKVIISAILFSIIINPFIYGFYHTLLTEYVAITLAILSSYLAILWLDLNFSSQKKKYILYTIFFSLLTIFSWFLKQPYVSCGFFAMIIAYIISIFSYKNFKNFFIRSLSVLFCICCLFLSINLWNFILISTGNNPNTTRNPSNSLGNQLISALDFVKIENTAEIYEQSYLNSLKFSKSERKLLKQNKKEYVVVNIYNNDKLIDSDYIETNDENVTSLQAVKYIINLFCKHPIKVLDSYVVNYLSLIDIYSATSDDGVYYNTKRQLDFSSTTELEIIAYKPYHFGEDNIFYMLPNMRASVECYEQKNFVNKFLNYAMIILGLVYKYIFKIIFLLLPIFLAISIISRIKSKNKKEQKFLNLSIVLLGFSFLHIMLHVITGAVIDRYAIPSFIPSYLGVILCVLFLIYKIYKKKLS